MSRIVVEFSASRDLCGALTLIDDRGRKACGPWPVAGRATDALAEAHGNPRCNPLLRYGDTPTGSYRVLQTLRSGSGTPFRTAEFGSHGVILMEGISGDAAMAEANGRFHMLIIGGKPAKKGGLRSTAGALRLANKHQQALLGALQKLHDVRCDIIERKDAPKMGAVAVDASCQEDDPPLISESRTMPRQAAGSRPSRRDARRAGAGGAAGAMVFSFSVSFIALQSTTSTYAHAQVALESSTAARASTKFALQTLAPSLAFAGTDYDGSSAGQAPSPPPAPPPPQQEQQQTIQLNPGAQTPEGQQIRNEPNTNQGPAPAANTQQQLRDMTNGTTTLNQGFTGGGSTKDERVNATPVVPETPSAAPVLTDSQQQQLAQDPQYKSLLGQQQETQKDAADKGAAFQKLEDQRKSNPTLMQNQTFLNNYYSASQASSQAASAAATNKVLLENRRNTVIGAPIYKNGPAPKDNKQ